MSSSKTPLVLPTAIDRYQIRAVLGGGTFGTVYRAFDPRLDREVALKVLRPELTTSAQVVERFLREAKAAAKLFHPHIVPVYDAGRAETQYYIASAFIQGNTLAAAIPKEGMEPKQAAELVAQLASALGYAHRQGVLHRDVKPQNIMVDEQGSLYLMDFGLAAWVQEEGTRLTQDGAMMGTPAYMAPEQACGDNTKVGPAADLYSAGVVLYELLTGRRPFEGHPASLVYQIVYVAPPPPLQYQPALDPLLDAICLKALAKDPAERFLSGEDMAAALRGLRPSPPPSTATEASFDTQLGGTLGAAGPRSEFRTPKKDPPAERGPAKAAQVGPTKLRKPKNDPTAVKSSNAAKPGRSAPPAAKRRPQSGSRLPRMLSVLASVAVLVVLAAMAVGFFLHGPADKAPKSTPPGATTDDRPVVSNNPQPIVVQPPKTETLPPPPPPAPAREVTVAGMFVGVDKDRLTLRADDGEKRFMVVGTTRVTIDGKDGRLADIKKESSLTVTSKQDVLVAVQAKSPPPGQAALRQGKQFLDAHDYDAAINALAEAERLAPSDAVARAYRARARPARHRLEESRSEAEEAVRLAPQSALAHAVRGRIRATIHDIDAGLEDAEEAVRLDPKLPEAYYARGAVYLAKRNYDKAIADCDESLRLDPLFVNARLNRAKAWKSKRELDKAMADYDEAIRNDPKDAAAYAERGIAWRDKGEYDKAIADCDAAVKLDPKSAAAFSDRGLVWNGKKEYDKALADHDEAVRIDPKYAIAFTNRGLTWNDKKEYNKALADYDEAVRIDPKYAYAYAARAWVHYGKFEYGPGIEDCTEAIRLDPKLAYAYYTRAYGRQMIKETDKAIDDYSEAIKIEPKYAFALNNRGNAWRTKGEYDKAIDDYSEAIKIDPRLAITFNNRGYAWHVKKEYDKAIDDFDEAIKIDPKYAIAFTNRGNAYKAKGDQVHADADFAEVTRLKGGK